MVGWLDLEPIAGSGVSRTAMIVWEDGFGKLFNDGHVGWEGKAFA